MLVDVVLKLTMNEIVSLQRILTNAKNAGATDAGAILDKLRKAAD